MSADHGDDSTLKPSDAAGNADTLTAQVGAKRRSGNTSVLGVGDRVGRHTVLSTLGEGGFGQVFLAHDENLKRKVALKVLYGESSEETKTRFRREGEALATLAHPNVVAVYDVVEHEGKVVLSMEYVPGLTLTAWARGRPWREVLGALLQSARGLAAAHAAGLVHRDFKPDNVLMGLDGRARVADFGLAARSNEGAEGRTVDEHKTPDASASLLDAQLTQDGMVMGTPFYMAPELRYGVRATANTDQYAFCKAVQHLLTGRRRGEGDDDVPAWVDALANRGLKTEPLDRWPDMAAVVAELETRLGVRPELDPRRSATARRVLLGGQMLLGLGATALAIALGGDEVLSPKMLLILGVWQFAVAAGFIAVGWRWFEGSLVGQRVSAVVGLTVTGMLANRLLANVWQTPGPQVLATDLVLGGVVLVAAGLFVQRWAMGAALVMFGAAALGGLWPAVAPTAFLLAVAGVILQALVFLRRPDQLKPGYLVDFDARA